ncbi:uncharacterized protein LOC126551448 isoform X2 [Aphis gossypii]|uniref:uncharacterized protein LOC126551448 isoform X2 n=1 Tax=Aphis gossypii TaxID=80765 RepID=UPI002158F20E|nr:uncharacterized protein LOC126551448 isoform X2 [Aphis gossypii]
MSCCVPNCLFRDKYLKQSRFYIPKDLSLRYEWEKALKINFQNNNSRVCRQHFRDSDIIDSWVSGTGDSKYTVCLKIPKLRNGAIPIPVPDSPDNLISSINSINIDHCYAAKKPQENNIAETIHNTGIINNLKRNAPLFNIESIPKRLKVEQKITLLNLNIPTKWFCDIDETLIINNQKQIIISFHKLGSYTKNVTQMRCIEKQLILNEESDIFLYAFDKKIELSDIGVNSNIKIDNHTEIEKIIKIFDTISLCKGAVPSNKYRDVKLSTIPIERCGMWWHSKCITVLPKDDSSNSDTCIWCKRLWYIVKSEKLRQRNNQSIRTFFSPTKKKTISKIRKAKNTITKKFSRAHLKITCLQNHLKNIKDKMKKITHCNLDKVLQNSDIPNCQSELIHEIFKAAKLKNPKNRKYSENWLLLCMLFQIRSPSGYKFLRDQNILPLPCVNTIRKHLLAVEIGCGFDNNFFKLLKKKFDLKSEQQKQGVIVLDEIFLRENICVNSRTLTYMGLEDFGEELNNTNSSQKANHALVLMWQSLADNFVQPIAVFASHGTVKGVDLAKLVIRAILLMENAGGQVVGLTSDGATTNRTMWNLLGICPNSENFKNYFENPYDSSRKVFVFSDTPHLLKTIRNRLYEKKQLLVHPSKTPIKWEHYQNVYKIEANSLTKACPKINKNHFELNNLSKMKVKYAAQEISSRRNQEK